MTLPPREAPKDVIAAVTHPDPYPYYGRLVRQRPWHYDTGLKLWIAASAAAVAAVLQSPLCRVRPSAEPVPMALRESSAGAVFGKLVRMTDGPRQQAMKQAVMAAISAQREVAETARRMAQSLLQEGCAVDDFLFALPVRTMAALLGIPEERHALAARHVGAYMRGVAPLAAPDRVRLASQSADALLSMLRELLEQEGDGLLWRLRDAAGGDIEAVLANAIGLMMQSHDATAGLIGNTLLALRREEGLHEAARRNPGLLQDILGEVLRHDPPTQNTRRFVAEDGMIAGQQMRAGDAILVLLAAAGRDPAANPEPDRFLAERAGRRHFNFGLGRHACAGEGLAIAIAQAGLAVLLEADAAWPALRGYRPSVNIRIPCFQEQSA